MINLSIKLIDEEQKLFSNINFDIQTVNLRDDDNSSACSQQLMAFLTARDAFPSIRMQQFTDRKFSIPANRKTFKEQFQKYNKSITDRELYEDPHFYTDWLRYFVSGPDLPAEFINEICTIVKTNPGIP